VAQFLRDQGYRAFAISGGLHGWVQAGLPTETKEREQSRTVADVCPECGQALSAHGSQRAGR
jgi:3-mercaptopyruvate sulfurtransferase SseA